MEPLSTTAPNFNLRWVLHNMGDELGGVYLTLFWVKPYIGVTKDRTKRNKNGTDFSKGYNRKVKNAFKKHGVTDFMFISCSLLCRNVIEGFFLEEFKEMAENGDTTICNLKFSYGQGGDAGPEARAKISEANSGEKHPQYGKTGEKSHNYGKKRTPETRAKLSEANSGEKNPKYDDTVYNFQHKDGRIETCTQWALRTKYNLHHGNLSKVVRGKRGYKSTGGWSSF